MGAPCRWARPRKPLVEELGWTGPRGGEPHWLEREGAARPVELERGRWLAWMWCKLGGAPAAESGAAMVLQHSGWLVSATCEPNVNLPGTEICLPNCRLLELP
jgi:hypothetical protein